MSRDCRRVFIYDDVSSNNRGRLKRTGMSDGSGSMAYGYDDRGRLTEEKRTVSGWEYFSRHGYDPADRVSTTQMAVKPPGQAETVLDTVSQGYDERGLPKELSSTANGTIVKSVSYNDLALPTQMVLGNDVLKTSFSYWNTPGGYQSNDPQQFGRLYQIKTVKISPETTPQDVRHTWDATGNLSKRETWVSASSSETESFAYDFLDRLTSQSNFLFSFGDTGDPSSRVSTPYKAAVDASGNIWVADWDNGRIARYSAKLDRFRGHVL